MNDFAKGLNAGGINHALCEKSVGMVNWDKNMLVGQCEGITLVLKRL